MTTDLLLAALFLFATHAVPSWPGVRPWLIARLGRGGVVSLPLLGPLLALRLFLSGHPGAGGGRPPFFPPRRGWAPVRPAVP
ncbi:hypothetical protein GAY30_34495, partial [Azospirillum brasilense]|nr:hypothetical protein [Azospirillum brasilense]